MAHKGDTGIQTWPPASVHALTSAVHYHSPTELAPIATPEAVPCFMVYKSLF